MPKQSVVCFFARVEELLLYILEHENLLIMHIPHTIVRIFLLWVLPKTEDTLWRCPLAVEILWLRGCIVAPIRFFGRGD